ncbi:hypothetical protein [Methanobacterium oryzae]|uniref:hypothetical protein n=1 Tax=Methanobacterium oryzae TaxID=69540 RepID=UPI003D220C54
MLNKNFYSAYGLNICSEIEFPELNHGLQIKDVSIRFGKNKFHRKNNEVFIVNEKDIYFFFNDLGIIRIHNGLSIIIDPLDNIDENSLREFIMGTGLALLLFQRGFLILHGSAVKINNHAIAFLGNSGLGKSTLAWSFYLRNYPVVTDDVIAVQFDENNRPMIWPGFSYLRISNEFKNSPYNSSKRPLLSIKKFEEVKNGFSPDPVPLKSIYVLENGFKSCIHNLSFQKALLALISNSRCSDFFQSNDQSTNLKQCSHLFKNINIKSLKIKKDIHDLSKLVNMVENDILIRSY